jgi:hypothetical protein
MSKSRNQTINIFAGVEHLDGSPASSKTNTQSIYRETMLGGEGHYGYPNFPAGRAVGGDFILNQYKFETPLLNVGKIWRGGPLNQYYVGGVSPNIGWLGSVGGNLATVTSTMGSDAYNRMKPTQPSFQGLNAIYELRELPEMLRQRFLSSGLHAIPNYWLALQFGWRPLLNDIRNFVLTQIGAQKRLNQLLRDNGRPVRRSCTLFDNVISESRSTTIAYQVMSPGFVTQYYPRPGISDLHTKDYDRAWASARFVYHLPDGPRDVNWTTAMKARIFGLYPSPSVVYNALPWTWLGDWFVNVSSMLQNMEAGVADRLAADYFYVMHERGGIQTNTCTSYFLRQSGEEISVSGTSIGNWAHKVRSVGDPFGWNTPENNLSGMQLSILGALGMSRLR